MLTDDQYREALETAKRIGHEHGENAAAWWEQDAIGGRATGDVSETASRVIRGLSDGDPEVYDSLPYPDLSGQWADSYGTAELLRDCLSDGVEPEDDVEYADLETEVCNAYSEEFTGACYDAVERYCLDVLKPTDAR